MAVYFFVTSAIVKRYVQEIGAPWVQNLVDPKAGHHIYLARIAAVEVASAVARRERGGNLPTATAAAILGQFRQDMIQQYRVLEVTPPLLL
jgi:hypothetical protein